MGTRPVVFEQDEAVQCRVVHRHELSAGDEIIGPAVIEQLDATTLVYPDDTARVDNFGNLLISLGV
jgi:N-methylhydantoinase A